jgi:hypothetical protein
MVARRGARLIFSFVVVSSLFCFVCAGARTSPLPSSGVRYVAIIDAGSSGSRIYLFKAIKSEGTSEAQDLMEFEGDAPGLSSFATTPEEAGEKGVAPLLHHLADYLEAHNIETQRVEVSVLATAGMRLIDAAAQRAIFESVRRYIAGKSFAVGDIEIISGDMEGTYSWVDVNFLLGRFRDRQPTIGVVEIGGASAQIAFETQAPMTDGHRIEVGSQRFDLFVESFLGLGRNESRRRMVQSSDTSSGFVENPCYPRGLVSRDVAASASGLTGGFKYEACVRIYDRLLGRYDLKRARDLLQAGDRSFAAIGTGNPIGTFWGLLEAWKIRSFNPYDILASEMANCDKSWRRFEAEYGGGAFNETQCADSTFVTSFLYGEDGLRLKSDTVRSYKSINGKTPTWTRGVVVLKYLN